MNKTTSQIISLCFFAAILTCLAGHACAEKIEIDTDTIESVSENKDPFALMKALQSKATTSAGTTTAARTMTPTGPPPDVFMESVMLNFLRAENLATVVANMNSPYGIVSTDTLTNTVIICDTRKKLDSIIAEIKKVDRTPRQVLIEVVIVDVQLDDDTEIGVNWDYLSTAAHTKSYQQNLINTLGSSLTNAGAGFGIIQNNITTTIHALQQTKNVEILASPTVIVVSGQQATIKTVEQIPYTELTDSSAAGQNALSTTEFRDVGITLTVTAIITDENKILLKVASEQSVDTGVTGLSGDVPIIDERAVSTTLLLEDSQVVIMGGLRRKETTITQDKVPLFGDLPLIGFLFSNDKTVVRDSELLVLLSPHIYTDKFAPNARQMQRFNELKDAPPLEINIEDRKQADVLGQRPEFNFFESIFDPKPK